MSEFTTDCSIETTGLSQSERLLPTLKDKLNQIIHLLQEIKDKL